MNYEEKYNEILAWARKNKARLNGVPIEEVLPELAESEDERIRKALIEVFKKKLERGFEWVEYGIPNRSVLDWLEKQKETGIRWFKSDNVKNPDKPHIDKTGMFYTTDGRMCYASEIEKQKEQKPVSNPKWNELTWKDINELERIINNVHYEFRNGIGEDSFGELVLERFREYKDDGSMAEQKPAEWSEEDEKDMAHIIRILDDCYVYGTHDLSKTDRENLVNKLKSLRPSWKPSKEQMKALYDACCIAFEEERDFHPSLSRLYHDLRKL